MKNIYILRHAKAAPATATASDIDRPLRRRGRQDAKSAAAYLLEHDLRPDLVLCSPARRARETLAPLLDRLTAATEVSFEPGIYLADAPALLARLRRLPDAKSSVLLVGHNPGLQDLVESLAATSVTRARVAEKFPTAAIAFLCFDGRRWRSLAPGRAALVNLFTPADRDG